jgi:hypothetical protein
MNQGTARWTAFAFACLLVAACKPGQEPIKPPVKPITATAAAR